MVSRTNKWEENTNYTPTNLMSRTDGKKTQTNYNIQYLKIDLKTTQTIRTNERDYLVLALCLPFPFPGRRPSYTHGIKIKNKIKMPNGWRTIKSLVHKIRLHDRRGKGMAESFSREKLRQAPQKEGGWKILLPSSCVTPAGTSIEVQNKWSGLLETE